MIRRVNKFIIWLITIVLVIEPILLMPKSIKAEDTGGNSSTSSDLDGNNTDSTENQDSTSGDGMADDSSESDPGQSLDNSTNKQVEMANQLSRIAYPDLSNDANSIFSFEENVYGVAEPKITMNYVDLAAINFYYYIGQYVPDFNSNIEELWNTLPTDKRPASVDDLIKLKFEKPSQFDQLVRLGRESWLKTNTGSQMSNKALAEITNYSESYIESLSPEAKAELVSFMTDSIKLDSRVLKTLVYLITPKNQGGAGHWKIKVRKITQFVGKPLSTESDAILRSLSERGTSTGVTSAGSSNTAASCDGLTAADCGQTRRDANRNSTSGSGSTGSGSVSGSGTTEPDITATDSNGDEWEGYLNGQDGESDPLKDRNISAHSTGQAIDISQVDDIRCTLIKRRRLKKSSYLPQPARPIKLAWQTSDGYAASGGNPIDVMGIFKQSLTEDIRDLVSNLGGDVTNYEGDLSSANLSDVIGLVGKSLFAEIVNSPSHNLSGYNASETLKNLGSMYFADYFGLPREIFIGREFTSIDDVQEIIGEAAIEKRLSLPYGSLSSKNFLKTVENQGSADPELKGKTVYDLEGTFLNVGQRKLEYEMNLNPGDLDSFISMNDSASSQNLDLLIGRRVIEKELNLRKDTFAGSLDKVKEAVGKFKFDLIFKDPTYLDTVLHLKPGTSRDLISGRESPDNFAQKVGETRKTDTLNGLRYFAANDSAYNLPEGTWDGMLVGKRSSFVTAGSYTLGRLIADPEGFSKYLNQSPELQAAISSGQVKVTANPDNLGIAAMQQWFAQNLGKTDKAMCKKEDDKEIKVTVPVNVTYSGNGAPASGVRDIEVTLSEDKALEIGLEKDDLFNMFGCSRANTKWVFERVGSKLLYYGIANKMLTQDEKVKIDLMDTEPEFKTDNPEILFYLNRIDNIEAIAKEIKSDWKNENEPELKVLKDKIIALVDKIDRSNVHMLDVKESKGFVRDILQDVAEIKLLAEDEVRAVPSKISKINATIFDINNIIRNVSEMLAGRAIPSTDLIKIDQIDTDIFNNSDFNSSGASYDNSSGSNLFKKGANVRMIFDLLARRIDVGEFFIKLGCSKAESELDLPPNALFYLVKNYEDNGVKGLDAFYMAIGQAKIEDNFNMPSFYFQGDEFGKNMPDFANDFNALYQYASTDIDNFRAFLTTISIIFSAMPLDQLLSAVKVSYPDAFKTFIDSAKNAWRYEENVKKQANGGVSIVENTLDDVVVNINHNGLGDGLRTGDKDLLFRMGIVNKDLAAMARGEIDSATNTRLEKIDKNLGLKAGTTKALIMKQQPRLTKGEDLLSQDEKKQIEATLDIRKNTLDTYLRLLNGDIKLNELKGEGLTPDYNVANPYAKQDDNESCPLNFELKPGSSTKGDFVINEKFLEDDSYCINDQDGRHCFQSKDEAIRYQSEHADRKFENVLDSIAMSLSKAIVGNDSRYGEFKGKLVDIVSGKSGSVLTDQDYSTLTLNNISNVEAGGIAIPLDLIKKTFSRGDVKAPLIDYKKAVGKAEAARVLQSKLFYSLGFRIDPSLFDSSSFYEILSGNFSAIYDLGAQMVEQYIGEKIGTVRAIIRAANVNTLNCAMSQAGATMLGGLLGLDSVSIKGNIIHNIGQAQLEETIGLPKGSFHGDSIYKVVVQARPINFALAFRIPLGTINPITNGNIINQDDLGAIIGKENANSIKNASDQYKLKRIKSTLEGQNNISQAARDAISRIEAALYDYIPKVLSRYANGTLADGTGDDKFKPYLEEANKFRSLVSFLDTQFGLKENTTGDLLKGLNGMTPDQYISILGNKKILQFGLAELAEMLGLDEEAAQAAATILTNINATFNCQQHDPFNPGECTDNRYWKNGGLSPLVGLFSQIFKVNLDDKAHFKPGTIESIVADPKHATTILIGQAVYTLDQKLKIDSTKDYSFTNLYKRFTAIGGYEEADANCISSDWDSLTEREHYYSSILNDPKSTEAQKQDAQVQLASINTKISQNNASEAACKRANRTDRPVTGQDYKDATVEWIREGISQYIHDQILTVKAKDSNGREINIGINMPESDIQQLVFEGKIVFLEIAAMAMTVNYILDGLDPNNASAVPAAMRVSYDDIKNAFFTDKAAVNSAMNYATWAVLNGEAYDPSKNPYGMGDLCPVTGDIFTGLVNCTTDANNALPRDGGSILNGMNGNMQGSYGCIDDKGVNHCNGLGNNYGAATLADYQNQADSAYDAWMQAEDRIPDGCDSTKAQSDVECKAALDAANSAYSNYMDKEVTAYEIQDAQAQAARNVKKAFKEALEYRMMDQMLWKMDKNIFPGFSYALMKGNASVKKAALAMYLKNGLRNGNIFGIKFEGVANLEMWLQTAQLVMNGQASIESFVNGGGFDQLSNYIYKNFEKWFGIQINPDMAKGLLLGVTTGHWGQAGNEKDTFKIGTHDIPTFLGAITNWAEGRIFGWADRHLGLPAGTSYTWFSMAKKIYETTKTFNQINALTKTYFFGLYYTDASRLADGTRLNGMLSNSLKTDILKITGKTNITPADLKNFDINKLNLSNKQKADIQKKFKEAKHEMVGQLGVQLATIVITFFVHKWLGSTVSAIEAKLGLVPGSLMVLLDAGIAYGVAIAAHSMGIIASTGGPVGLYIALAIFVVMNLFGVYKVELKCNADGYYFHRENPQPNIVDVTDLGVWDGLNAKTNQEMSIRAAQYKARRLIADMLTMHNNPLYKDIYPSQILTGRNEDVEALADSIQVNLCDQLGVENKNGICEGTLAGVWKNPQTVAWTHIGF